MAYRIEGNDIVISGFENGIADSPYSGISDMRNIETDSIPGEASVAFSPSLTTTQGSITTTTYTASNSGGDLLFTYNGTVPLVTFTAIQTFNSGGARPTGITANTAYYVTVISGTTFKVSATASSTFVAYTDAGSGTNTFSTINMAQPKFIVNEPYKDSSSGAASTSYHYYLVDTMERCWYYNLNTQWIYMNNLNGENSAGVDGSGNGLALYPGAIGVAANYLFTMRVSNVDYISTVNLGTPRTLAYLTTNGNWHRSWKALSNTSGYTNSISHYCYVGATDNTLYFCDGAYLGTIGTVAGAVFNPAGTVDVDYTFSETSLALPSNDVAQCISQLGTNLLIGGAGSVIYSWDRISIGYVPIFLSESNTQRIVVSNTTGYAFCGQRGNIYQTNGSQVQFYKKVPDHLSGTVNPYFTWGDAVLNRNFIYFGVSATDNTGTAINNYGGTWILNLRNSSLRLLNQQSYGSYAGIVSAISPVFGVSTANGYALLMGWYTASNTTGGVDKSSSTPYTGGQSYFDSDFIPVSTILTPFTPSQVEWKTSVPIGANGTSETIALYFRKLFSDSFAAVGTTFSTTSSTGVMSAVYTTNFEEAQWIQLRAVSTSNATTPTYNRITEIRIRDYFGPTSNSLSNTTKV